MTGPRPARDVWAVRFGGVLLKVAPSGLLLAGWLTLVYAGVLGRSQPELGAARFGVALLFPLLLGISVLLHELGHAAVGAAGGLRVRSVEVSGLGGETRFWGSARGPGHSFLIAAAGPAVSALLGAASGVAAALIGSGGISYLLLSQVAIANILLTLFNLLPGLPLDGGWMLQAAVWAVSGSQAVAGIVAAWAGVGVAGALVLVPVSLLVLAGYTPSLLVVGVLLLIAAPVGYGAWSALGEAHQDRRLVGSTALTLARPIVVTAAGMPAGQASMMLRAYQCDAAVVVDGYGRAVALVSSVDLERAVGAGWEGVAVWQLATPLQPEQVLPAASAGPDVLDRIRDRDDVERYLLLDAPAGFMVLAASDVRRAATGQPHARTVPFAPQTHAGG